MIKGVQNHMTYLKNIKKICINNFIMNYNDKSKATFLFYPVRTKEDYKKVLN